MLTLTRVAKDHLLMPFVKYPFGTFLSHYHHIDSLNTSPVPLSMKIIKHFHVEHIRSDDSLTTINSTLILPLSINQLINVIQRSYFEDFWKYLQHMAETSQVILRKYSCCHILHVQ